MKFVLADMNLWLALDFADVIPFKVKLFSHSGDAIVPNCRYLITILGWDLEC